RVDSRAKRGRRVFREARRASLACLPLRARDSGRKTRPMSAPSLQLDLRAKRGWRFFREGRHAGLPHSPRSECFRAAREQGSMGLAPRRAARREREPRLFPFGAALATRPTLVSVPRSRARGGGRGPRVRSRRAPEPLAGALAACQAALRGVLGMQLAPI